MAQANLSISAKVDIFFNSSWACNMNVISTDIIFFHMAMKKSFFYEYVQGKNIYS